MTDDEAIRTITNGLDLVFIAIDKLSEAIKRQGADLRSLATLAPLAPDVCGPGPVPRGTAMSARRHRHRSFSPGVVLLAQHGVSLADIAEALGVTGPTVSRYVAGHSRPHPDLFQVVADLAGTDVALQLREILESDAAADG